MRWLGWDANSYILADLVDVVNANTAVLVAINSKDHQLPDTETYPRPSDKKVEKPSAGLDNFAEQLIKLGLA